MKISFKISLIIVFLLASVVYIYSLYEPQNSPVNDVISSTNRTEFADVPRFLQQSFPNTDFSNANPAIQEILTGGPPKDGIPAIDEPTFTSLAEYNRPDTVEAIVVEAGAGVKVYPYNILTWHEIVNDTVDGTPIAVTFCPLCGSAIVYDRRTDAGVTTFGVSGALIESNMVMYDRQTESLWQQSTGKALTGELYPTRLELYPFQLLTMGEVRERYYDAQVLSEGTGYARNYGRNPYSGYTEDDRFIFTPSSLDERYEPKEIMVVFRVGDEVVATPWLNFSDGTSRQVEIAEKTITLTKADGELEIVDESSTSYPFFFEMWFSFAVQNPDGRVIE